MSPEQVRSRTEPLVRFLRQRGSAGARIVLVEGTPAGWAWLAPGSRANDELRAAFVRLTAAGVAGLHYVNASRLYERSALYGAAADVTNAGVHPGDVGMRALAEFWTEFLSTLGIGGKVELIAGGRGRRGDDDAERHQWCGVVLRRAGDRHTRVQR
eukprot:gene39541-7072_t